ncbi:multidrug transporter MATE [Marinomonas sp. S3726]|uniref:MATE family efflux transporter n=1 Tax=Marinomonas sp. S3726 TaxID=579484 RepID=UPI0005FA7E6A|nr:MATE family efflux transporter [Marinomonas sp. S3726]KJZ16286.1 multidrug transporter MATE [Marinomonas sp. S3726]
MPLKATFTSGSTLRHVVVMSATGAFGLMSMFMVDLIDILFLSMLDQKEVVAAVGFASSIMFFTISLSIAVSISATALVSKAVGQGDREQAKRRATNVLVFGVLFSFLIIYFLMPRIPHLLYFLGANGITLDLATSYLQISILGMPAIMVGMIGSGIMRALGDAKRAMYATLISGLVNAVLDPLLIFGLGLGLDGAAIASLIARCSMLAIAYYGLVNVHQILSRFDWLYFAQDFKQISFIAFPAMLTNMSSPLANAIVTEHMATFGDDAVAAYSIIGRVIPVVFGGLFALSGAVGPILGQNYGAGNFLRMQQTLTSAVIYSLSYCVLLCLSLYELQFWLIDVFSAGKETAALISFFATYISYSFFFQSLLFIGIATFNNLGSPKTSAWLNFGRATLGTWPLIVFFGWFFDAKGIFIGQALGSIIFGCIAFTLARRYIAELEVKTN